MEAKISQLMSCQDEIKEIKSFIKFKRTEEESKND